MWENLRVVEAKCRLRLVHRDLTGNLRNITIESAAHKIEIAEDEGPFHLEPNGDDITSVPEGVFISLLGLQLVLEQELLII